MNNLHEDMLLSRMRGIAKKLTLVMASGPKLMLAFVATLTLIIVGSVAVYVVLPIILLLLGGILFFNLIKGVPIARHTIMNSKNNREELEAVYLHTICAELIQKISSLNKVWSFDQVGSYLAGEGADIETVIEACVVMGWVKINFEARYITLTSKGIKESREYLEWTGTLAQL